MDAQSANAWELENSQEALNQIADLLNKMASWNLSMGHDGCSFSLLTTQNTKPCGILSAYGKLEGSQISVKLELFRGPEDVRISSAAFFQILSKLGERIRLSQPHTEVDGQKSLWVELRVQAVPLSITRAEFLLNEIKNLKDMAMLLQGELPCMQSDSELVKLYTPFADILDPVFPATNSETQQENDLMEWARDVCEFLSGSINVAIASEYPIYVEAALVKIAGLLREQGRNLGNLIVPAVNARGLLDICKKAPGTVAVSAAKISLGSNPYEMANEMVSLLTSLSDIHNPVVFTGKYQELQALFHGGQGSVADPIRPVLRRVPQISMQTLTRFALTVAGRRKGGITHAALDELAMVALVALKTIPEAQQARILPPLAMRMVAMWNSGEKKQIENISAFVAKTAAVSETLCGLSARPKAYRKKEIQEHFTRVLTGSELLSYFQSHLLAQDRALLQLCQHLEMECLTRPLHQPLRYCVQSPPGTGKSQSAVLLAKILEVPFINIDAASMSDHHTASSQLLGSGRGIVGSHQSGRLEQAAKHHTGVVIEVSDLDHAKPSVRASLADLFLQVLDTGEAQSATGAMFSCANVILVFTMNLPGGMDEHLHKGFGFTYSHNRGDMKRRVASEIKSMLSGAFLSRVGSPIVFEPLSGEALALIVERTIKQATLMAASQLKRLISDVVIETGTGETVLKGLEVSLISYGARALLEHGRSLAAQAVLRWVREEGPSQSRVLIVSADHHRRLIINTK